MKPEWQRFAPWGLYLALVGALTSIGLYIVQREWNLYLQISLGLIVVGIGLFAILDPQRVRNAMTGRQAKYGSNALILSLAFIGILVVINYLVFENSKRWDLTEDQQFTLSPETLDTLRNLPEGVEARAFYTSRLNTETAENLLRQYQFYGDGKLNYEFIDPENNPVAAEEANITRDGTIVLSSGENQEQVTIVSEQELTGALIRLMNPEKRIVYFLTGHGEHSPEDTGEQSYSFVKRTLEGKNYTVKLLNLLAENEIPSDAEVVVIAGPQQPLSKSEVELLSQYVASGGALISLVDPTVLTDFGDAEDPLAAYLSQNWGIGLRNDLVVDLSSNSIFLGIGAQYGSSPITEKIRTTNTVFPTVRSVKAEVQVTGSSQVQLVLTSPNSWAEMDMEGLTSNPPKISFDEGIDEQGPIPVAVAAENFDTGGKVAVFGDSEFANDGNFPAYANSDLIINTVDWAAGKEELINLTPKNTTQRLMVPPQSTTLNLILLVVVVLIPGLGLLGGIVVWIQKRRRG